MRCDPDWRTRHCAEPAVDLLKQATGRDLWAEMGGCPRSPREAADFYRRLGVRTLKDAVTAVLGSPIPPRFAMRNDIALVNGSLGIVRGDLIEGVDGLAPIGGAECCWRVAP